MTEQDKDRIFFRFQKGHYAPGGKWENATQPMYRSHNGAVVSSAEPEGVGNDTIQFSPPRMQADPFDGSAKAKAGGALEVEQEPMIQSAEAEDAYTPIACFVEGEPAGSVR